MRLWINKISLVLAIMVITAHNLVFHDHELHHIVAQHLSPDHGKHGLFALNLIDHCFTSQYSNDLDHTFSAFTLAPVPAPVSLPEIICYPVLKTSYQLKHEFPPPLRTYSSTFFRGPPALSA